MEAPREKSLGKGVGFEVGCRDSRQTAKWIMDISIDNADVRIRGPEYICSGAWWQTL